MNPKMIVKISVDFVMTILLLFLMGRQITGESAHEWLGAGIFILWIIHHILNFKWHRHLAKGKYTPFRVIQVVVNLLLLLAMIGTMVSAVILSREVFAFLPISGGIALARPMHILCVFWAFVLMALHLGLHWNMILGMIRKACGPVSSKPVKGILRVAGAVIAVYGLYAFVKNQFLSYMFLTAHFVFFDFERPLPLFFTEYIAIMGLFVFLAHYGAKGIQTCTARRRKQQQDEK
ncbi:membrane protein [Claveliimonas bilis]|uniref:Membrane protein n=1 Tax=Claveliimonas bilis TaxID=3028070 RepID=A0ABM8I9F1_9FIRM|nr:DUF4405 domain-containing protein [Claveliimonas bilis]BCZ27457.1 membrane protein [Claveliimonas bilis]BDZ78744.1 membrane protein [Claveliimonas bilis]